jgi:hypothetical protein
MTETPRRHGFPSNRRDGARLLSTVLLVAGASLIRIDHPVGRILFLAAACSASTGGPCTAVCPNERSAWVSGHRPAPLQHW